MKVSLWKSASTASRPKPGQGQSIRGKISGPIPIPNPVDDEFPMRNPGTGIATPLGAPDQEFPLQPPPLPPPVEASSPVAAPSPSRAEAVPSADKNTDSAVILSGSTPTNISPSALTAHHRRTNTAGGLRYSAVSESTGQTAHSNDGPQRKKSTLRHALGRLFGRKRKNGSQGSSDTERNSRLAGSSSHRSDPSALNRVGTKDGEPKRSASLPITEYDRALRSHSIGPGDITAIESARNSLVGDTSLRTRRRAATVASQLYAPLRLRDGELAGLSPRPASARGRSESALVGEEDPEEIGRAITSDVIGHRRRSRSLSGLPNVADTHDAGRRRSDEIRYWRESYDPAFMSPLSSNAPEGEDTTGVIDVELPAGPDAEAPKTPPQPFTFGSMASMGEMAGMKITQAANLETRIGSLEARMRRMEKVVTQLCNTVPHFSMPLEVLERPTATVPGSDPSFTYTTSTAPLNPSLYQTASADMKPGSRYSSSRHSEESHSRMSFGEAPTFVGSHHPSTGLTVPAPANRPTSNATVRGATSLPALPRDISGPFTADHFSTLLALVETERSARQALELQVKKLNQRLNTMSVATVRQHNSTQLLDPPPTAKSFGQLSVFDDDDEEDEDDDDDDSVTEANLRSRQVHPQDSGIATGGGDEQDEDTYSEDFATPAEDRTFGAFGEVLEEAEGDDGRKKAARTLSLSQLTLGKQGATTPTQNPPQYPAI